MRILVVDDQPDTSKAVRRLLASRGHRVDTAATLADARRLCQAGRFDLILSDINLPDGSGWDLADLARRCDTRVVAISGYEADESRDAHLFDAYLVKPVSFEQILTVVGENTTPVA